MAHPRTRNVKCPECRAEVGWPCIGKRGPRYANHMARVSYAASFPKTPLIDLRLVA